MALTAKFPLAALIEVKSKPAVSLWLAADKRSTFTLEEAGRYVEGFSAVRDGKMAYEPMMVQMASALNERHKMRHLMTEEQQRAHPYDCSMRPVATFDGTVVYEMQGKLYALSYGVNGSNIALADDDAEVAAQFVPMLSPLADEQRVATESVDIGDGLVTGGLLIEGRVDKSAGVISGVVMINAKSSNGGPGGRLYSVDALRQIAVMSEGLPAFANHVAKEMAFRPRDVRDMIGRWRNVHFEESKQRVVGDLHVLASHRPWVMPLAEDMGDIVGASLVSRGAIRVHDGMEIVESIVSVRSGDLVSDPATTRGLFEHRERGGTPPLSPQPSQEETRMELSVEKILEALRKDAAWATAVKVALFGDELKGLSESKTKADGERDKAIADLAEAKKLLAKADADLAEAKVKLDGFEAADKVRAKQVRLQEALDKTDLVKKYKDVGVSDVFRASLMEADETKWGGLIEDRVKLLDGAKSAPTGAPRSSGKGETLAEGREDNVPADAHARLLRAVKL